jgi:hypothetical protein
MDRDDATNSNGPRRRDGRDEQPYYCVSPGYAGFVPARKLKPVSLVVVLFTSRP